MEPIKSISTEPHPFPPAHCSANHRRPLPSPAPGCSSFTLVPFHSSPSTSKDKTAAVKPGQLLGCWRAEGTHIAWDKAFALAVPVANKSVDWVIECPFGAFCRSLSFFALSSQESNIFLFSLSLHRCSITGSTRSGPVLVPVPTFVT